MFSLGVKIQHALLMAKAMVMCGYHNITCVLALEGGNCKRISFVSLLSLVDHHNFVWCGIGLCVFT